MARIMSSLVIVALMGSLLVCSVHSVTHSQCSGDSQNESTATVMAQAWGPLELDNNDHNLQSQWSPLNQNHAFIVNQRGLVKVRSTGSDSATVDAQILDMSEEVYSWYDRGMLSFTFHPDYGKDGNYYAYVFYAAQPEPAWPDDTCTTYGENGDVRLFCNSNARLRRIIIEPIFASSSSSVVTGYKDAVLDDVLIEDWCDASMTHHIGTLVWLHDGSMALAAGDNSQAMNEIDVGISYDPCYRHDGKGLAQGSFKSQRMDFLAGKIVRITPDAVLKPGGALTEGEDYYIVAKGLRNPFRMTVHPVSGGIYIGDVGSSGTMAEEEVNFLEDPSGATELMANFQWPCMEGLAAQPAFQQWVLSNPDQEVGCTDIYNGNDPLAHPPLYTYRDTSVTPFDVTQPNACEPNGATTEGAISGLVIYPGTNADGTGGVFDDMLSNKLIITDYAKQCVVYFDNNEDGTPNFSSSHVLFEGNQYVDVHTSNDGLIYFAVWSGSDYGVKVLTRAGTTAPPVASLKINSADAPYVAVAETIEFDASQSTTSSGTIVLYSWDVDGDGIIDSESTVPTYSFSYPKVGIYMPSVTVTTDSAQAGCIELVIYVGVVATVTMDPPSGEWVVGDTINYSLTLQAEDGIVITADQVTWSPATKHCTVSTCKGAVSCHNHEDTVLRSSTGFSGSFKPMPHEMPSYIALTATITVADHQLLLEFDTTAMQYNFTVTSVGMVGVSVSAGESGNVCPFSNPPCTIPMMAGNNLALAVDNIQADWEHVYELDYWSLTQGGATKQITTAYVTDAAVSNGVAEAVFKVVEGVRVMGEDDQAGDPILTAPQAVKASQPGPEQLKVQWDGVKNTDYYIVYLSTTVNLGHAHAPTSLYPQARAVAAVGSSAGTEVLVVPDGNYDYVITVRAYSHKVGLLGPASKAITFSVTSSNGQCVNTGAECLFTSTWAADAIFPATMVASSAGGGGTCTAAVTAQDKAIGLGAFYDVSCLTTPDKAASIPGCSLVVGDGCRACYTDRCLWSSSNGGQNPGYVPDCPPCVSDEYGVSQPVARGSCGFQSQAGVSPSTNPNSTLIPTIAPSSLVPPTSPSPTAPTTATTAPIAAASTSYYTAVLTSCLVGLSSSPSRASTSLVDSFTSGNDPEAAIFIQAMTKLFVTPYTYVSADNSGGTGSYTPFAITQLGSCVESTFLSDTSNGGSSTRRLRDGYERMDRINKSLRTLKDMGVEAVVNESEGASSSSSGGGMRGRAAAEGTRQLQQTSNNSDGDGVQVTYVFTGMADASVTQSVAQAVLSSTNDGTLLQSLLAAGMPTSLSSVLTSSNYQVTEPQTQGDNSGGDGGGGSGSNNDDKTVAIAVSVCVLAALVLGGVALVTIKRRKKERIDSDTVPRTSSQVPLTSRSASGILLIKSKAKKGGSRLYDSSQLKQHEGGSDNGSGSSNADEGVTTASESVSTPTSRVNRLRFGGGVGAGGMNGSEGTKSPHAVSELEGPHRRDVSQSCTTLLVRVKDSDSEDEGGVIPKSVRNKMVSEGRWSELAEVEGSDVGVTEVTPKAKGIAGNRREKVMML